MTRNIGYIGYQLKEMVKQGAIASVFTDPHNPDDFIAGYVRAINQRSTLIQSTSPFGRYDGFFAIRLSCILEVSMDAQYVERLERMMRINEQDEPAFPDAQLDWLEADHIGQLLRHAALYHRVVTAWTSEEAYTGFIVAADDLRCTMELLDFMGERISPLSINLTDIELCSIDSEEERMYEKLNLYK